MSRRRTREQWEQDVRDAQNSVTWDQQQRAHAAMVRNSPSSAMFKTKRELIAFVGAALAIVAGAMSLLLAWNWASHANQLHWSGTTRSAIISAIVVAASLFFWLGTWLFHQAIR